MLQITKRRTFVLGLVLVCLPLALVGCGGGNGGGVVQPTPTPTLTATAIPTLTAAPTATPATSGVNLRFTNRVDTTLPATVSYSSPQGQLYTQTGTTNVQISLNGEAQTGFAHLQFGKTGTISNQNVFALQASGISSAPLDNTLTYNFDGKTYVSQDGSCIINSITSNAGTNTVTVQFTLLEVKMVNSNDPNSTFFINGTGTVTLTQSAQ